jgi:tetratricopeptide (TPR) repeat protein
MSTLALTMKVPEWQSVQCSAMFHCDAGDIDRAISEMQKAIALMRPNRALAKELATSLNYLADLYLLAGTVDQAEEALRDSIELSRARFPHLHAANLWILGGIKLRQGKHEEAIAAAQESRSICKQVGHNHGIREAEELLEQIRANARAL